MSELPPAAARLTVDAWRGCCAQLRRRDLQELDRVVIENLFRAPALLSRMPRMVIFFAARYFPAVTPSALPR